ncbi:MAG: TonB-dependent receptor [Sphingobacteriia bacterium]|nr:TonB-dependent receptor [Sphingobacteriia bacterium]
MRKIFLASILGLSFLTLQAQMPGGFNRGGAGMAGRGNMNIGHFYGKAIDSKTGKGVAGATIILTGNKFDTTTKQMKQGTIKTVISQNNGDFNLENLPIFGNFKLKISAVGYKANEQQVAFNIKMPQMNGGAVDPNAIQQAMNAADKDLGNIKLEPDEADLGNVTVTTTAKQQLELGIDKKVFNVDKNLTSTGQTATEIMKSIPSLNVDIDGNVTLRNAPPTIFVDGRPTTMTLDQIPADLIDKVEIITNPSAKYDASGGNAGILNIVLKKNKKNGYNGGIRAGIDSRGKINTGADFNYRQGKINVTMSGMFNERKSIYENTTNQTQYYTKPNTDTAFGHTLENGNNNGSFGFGRLGLDYFLDNRNTFSVTGNYNKGHFLNESDQYIDSTINNVPWSHTSRTSNTSFNFQNFGGQLSYKHNFAENGHNITADANYNSSTTSSDGLITTTTYQPNGTTTKYPYYIQQAIGTGYNHYFTLQSDYENQITETKKLEAGIRGAIRDFKTENLQTISSASTGYIFTPNPSSSSRYKYNDQVYAAYVNYSFKVNKWAYQLGLRMESSNYTGHLLDANEVDTSTFKVKYPVSLFPSAFITYKIGDKQDFQINYSRRINRPNFFQLIPSYDFSNPTSPQVGNPNLSPEFTNSFEMSYNNNYMKGSNFLATVYFKYTTDLITRYSYKDVNKNTILASGDSLWYTTYINANNAYSYGLELTDKQQMTKWWDLTVNVNFYNSVLNATIPNQAINNSLLSWFGKMNNNFKVAKGWSVQFSGDYTSKTLIPQSSGGGGGGGRGGGFFGGGQQALAQGYILPRFGFDAAIRKDWNWKKGRTASLTLSMNDIFRTQLYKTTSESSSINQVLLQDSERRRDPQVLRVNFSYRFGKFDMTLFKRKNTKADQSAGMDMIGNQ